MADTLFDLLSTTTEGHEQAGIRRDPTSSSYLSRLSTLSLDDLNTTEPDSLSHSSQSTVRSLQALSKRSYKSIITSTDRFKDLQVTIPSISNDINKLHKQIPTLESAATQFSEKYSRSHENAVIERRRKAMLLMRNADRIGDILELPSLLSSAITSSASGATSTASTASVTGNTTNYAAALDLHTHIKRLHALYPDLGIIDTISAQAAEQMHSMKAILITSLQAPGIKLAAAMRIIGWLRRVAPELDDRGHKSTVNTTHEGALGAVFLTCRLKSLITTLAALDPLRDLADQETEKRLALPRPNATSTKTRPRSETWTGGQQTERYLKRYIEIFREQGFAIVSMFKSIFPSSLPGPEPSHDTTTGHTTRQSQSEDPPSALSTFTLHLVRLLVQVLEKYMSNVHDPGSRDSLLTQVLYCASSLGRLGGDFALMLTRFDAVREIDSDESEKEWISIMRKHRVQASRLELLASGIGTGRNRGQPSSPGGAGTPAAK